LVNNAAMRFVVVILWVLPTMTCEALYHCLSRSIDAQAWVLTLQTNSPEKHLDFARRFPTSAFALPATQRLYWLLEQRIEAAGPELSIARELALRGLRRGFLARLVHTVPSLPSSSAKADLGLVDWPDPYHWMRQIDKRWWLYALPPEEIDRCQQELAEGYCVLIDSSHPSIRRQAYDALGYLGYTAALDRLRIEAKGDEECAVAAVRAIGSLQDHHASTFLLSQLCKSPSPAVVDALGALRNRDAVPAISQLAEAKPVWTRRQACEALGLIGERRGLSVLKRRALDRNEDDLVRSAAIEGLGRLGDPRAVPALESTMTEGSPELYSKSVVALARIGSDEAIALLSAAISKNRNVVAIQPSRALANCGHPRSAETLVNTLYRSRMAGGHFSLVDQPPDRIFEGADEEFRRAGCGQCVAIVWSFRSTDRLLAILASGSDAMRGCAAYALGAAAVRDPRAVEALIPLLKDKGVAASAAFALGELQDLRALEPLIAALAHKDAVVRRFAAHGLGDLGDRRAVAPLVRLLDDKDASLAAVLALQRMKGKEAAPDLAAMLTRIGERAAEVKNIDKLKSAEKTENAAGSPLTTTPGQPTRRDLLEALRWIGNPAIIPAVLQIARNPSDPLHAQAARVVAELSRPRPETNQKDREVHGPFAKMTDDELVAMLVDPDRATYAGQRVFAELIARYRLPESPDEAIRYFVLIGARDDLMALWPRTRRVLLADLHGRSPQRQIYAARCLIRIGYGDNTAAELRDALLASDNKQLALDYFHCGNEQLRQAALDWSAKSGTVLENQPAGDIIWGSMKEE
jgi:HEAT repeat protein